MPLSRRSTLTQYLIEERRRYPEASGEFNALLLDVALACKAVARRVAHGALGGLHEGDRAPAALDETAQDAFLRANEWGGHLAAMASRERAEPCAIPAEYARGKYLLVFDALDGSGNSDVNLPVGSVFSVLRAPAAVVGAGGRPAQAADFLQAGAQQVAAGYAIYGPSTMLVLTVGSGVHGFTLDPTLGEFTLTHPRMTVPSDTGEFAINASHARGWEAPIKRYVDECLAGRPGVRGKDFTLRWIDSLVAEAHRILLRGGVFLDPRDARDPAHAGRLRLLFEANPIGFIMEQAGGRASTGHGPLLQVSPGDLHQRTGLVFGSRHEVERIERYHREPALVTDRAPLFAERSLFRDAA
jgi:fructose-1,6-bisphosphatase I/sedoheptulose-1,7-bisphosphatase